MLPPSPTTPKRKYLMANKILPTQKLTIQTQKQKPHPATILPDQRATTLQPDQSGLDYTTPRKTTTPSIREEHFGSQTKKPRLEGGQ